MLGFMVYIRQHISSFYAGVLVKMSEQPRFHHLLSTNRPLTQPSTHSTFHQSQIRPLVQATSSLRPPDHISINFIKKFTFMLSDQKYIQLPKPKGASKISDQNSDRISQTGYIQKLPTNNFSLFPSRGLFPISTQIYVHISQIGYISKHSQGTSIYSPKHTSN